MNKKIFRLVSLLAVVLAILAFLTAEQFFKSSILLKSFPGQVLESYPGKTDDCRPSLVFSLFFRTETEGNIALLQALGGKLEQETGNADYLSPSISTYINRELPLPLLMYKAFSASDLDACLRLSALWNGSPSGLFRSAVALENGSLEVSRENWERLPETDRESWLGRRILQQLNHFEKAGSSNTVSIFDRRGAPLGHIGEGKIAMLPGPETFRLPGDAIEKALLQADIQAGHGFRTSIDLNLQKAAVESLEGYRGSIVLMDPSTGEILAAASDPKTLRSEKSAPFTQQYEPASISKLVTSSAALRAGIDVDQFMEGTVCNGGKKYSGETLWCSFRSGRLGSLARALADSCNIAFADLGVAAGRQAILEELQIFGFDRPEAEPFHFGKITGKTGNDRQLADLSIGLESTTITPVHGALLAAVFANDGIMPEPSLLSSADGILGMSPEKISPHPGSWVINESESLDIINEAMRAVATNGTARGLSGNGFQVAMKTGTGRTSGTGYVTNYIGFGPLPNSQIAFCVRVTHQPTSSRVRKATREVMARLLERLSE